MAERIRTDDAIPAGLTRKHILEAIADFDQNGIPAGFKPSHSYDVIYESRRYPPPSIIALAIKALTGTLPPPIIRAGEGTRCFAVLRESGFQVVQKKN